VDIRFNSDAHALFEAFSAWKARTIVHVETDVVTYVVREEYAHGLLISLVSNLFDSIAQHSNATYIRRHIKT
jgi:hypothetical protein